MKFDLSDYLTVSIVLETYVGVLPQIELVHLNMTNFRSLLSPDPATGSLIRPWKKDKYISVAC